MQLRALEPEDLEILYTIENNQQMWWLSAQTAPVSRYHLRQYIAENEGDIYKDEQVRYVIDDDGTAIGLVDLFNFSPQNMRAEMGIAILEEYRHKGKAQEAIKEIIAIARDVLTLHQIYSIVPETNTASLSMLESVGFEHTADLKDWVFHEKKYQNGIMMQLFL